MKIIGFNLAKTKYGLPLDNGGACLIENGKVKMLINEERLNRTQYASGYKLSFDYILNANNLSVDDIDLFITSSCLEPIEDIKNVKKELAENGFDVPESKIKVCDHHLSHAYSAFYPSGFNKAVVMVLDGDGNVVDHEMKKGTEAIKKYWNNELEHI